MAKLVINENKTEGHINPEIYGHFSEHLGRCIYEGLYVKEDSGIPNVNGMLTDVVEALKRCRFRCCAGRADALRTSITGKTVSGRKKTAKR